MILLYAPEPSQSRWIDDLEHSRLPALPRDVVGIPLRGVVQELLQKVPEKPTILKKKKEIFKNQLVNRDPCSGGKSSGAAHLLVFGSGVSFGKNSLGAPAGRKAPGVRGII